MNSTFKKMLINGRFRTFGFWFSVVSIVAGLSSFVYFLTRAFDNEPIYGKLFFFILVIILISVYGKLLYDANLVTIDTESQTITFVNQFTRIKSIYNFSDFDGRLICYKTIKGGWAKFLYLVKDKRVVKKITDFMYSNEKELEEALAEIKDMGTIKYSYIRTWKMLLNKPVLE